MMTETDVRRFGLTAADLDEIAGHYYEPGDPRLPQEEWTYAQAVRRGRVRHALRSLAAVMSREESNG
jgi:hypothetical protein